MRAASLNFKEAPRGIFADALEHMDSDLIMEKNQRAYVKILSEIDALVKGIKTYEFCRIKAKVHSVRTEMLKKY